MNIIFMGTPDFAAASLTRLAGSGHNVLAVVTQPDRPKGRGKSLVASPVKIEAERLGLKVLQPEKVKDPEFIRQVTGYNDVDVIVVVAFGQIIPDEILNFPKMGCINVHASLLPKYRGASPIQQAVINGDEVSGVTTMMMDSGLDTGDILLQREVKLAPKETGGSLFAKLSALGAEVLLETLTGLERGDIKRFKQDDSKASKVSIIKKSDGEIDFSKSASEIERLIRGMNPWPSAFTLFKGKTLKIWEADVVSKPCENFKDGEVCGVTKDFFDVKCKEGVLRVKEVQLEGKKRMKVSEFLRGTPVACGEVLGG